MKRFSTYLSLLPMLIVTFCALGSSAGADASFRFVPKLSLSWQAPRQLIFQPSDPALLLSLNRDGRIDLFDVSRPDRPIKISEILAGALRAAFSPDGNQIATASSDGHLRLWRLDGSPMLTSNKATDGAESLIAYSPRGNRIATASPWTGKMQIWDQKGEPVGEAIKVDSMGIESLTFTRDGGQIATGSSQGVKLWNLEGSLAVGHFEGDQGRIRALAASPTEDLIIGQSYDGTVGFWRYDGSQATSPLQPELDARELAFSADGALVLANGRKGLQLWTPEGESLTPPSPWPRNLMENDLFTNSVTAAALSPNSWQLAFANTEGRVWIVSEGGRLAEIPRGPTRASPTGFAQASKSDLIAVTYGNRKARLWHLNGEPAGPILDAALGLGLPALSARGDRLALVEGGRRVLVFRPDGSRAIEPLLFEGSSQIFGLALSSDANRLLAFAPYSLKFWNLDGSATSVAFNAPEPQPAMRPLKTEFEAAAFAHEGGWLATLGFDGPRLRQATGEPVSDRFELSYAMGRAQGISFSLDDSEILTGGLGGLQRWSLSGKPLDDLRFLGILPDAIGVAEGGTVWAGAWNRIAYYDGSGKLRGQIFLTSNGFVGLTEEGIFATSPELLDEVAAYDAEGDRIEDKDDYPTIGGERLRDTLLGRPN